MVTKALLQYLMLLTADPDFSELWARILQVLQVTSLHSASNLILTLISSLPKLWVRILQGLQATCLHSAFDLTVTTSSSSSFSPRL